MGSVIDVTLCGDSIMINAAMEERKGERERGVHDRGWLLISNI